MTVWQWLDHIDKAVFTFIHAHAAIPWLDWLMLLLRNPPVWIPLYVFMLYWILRYGKAYKWKFILLTLVCFALTDFITADLKVLFARLRPCYDVALQPIIRNMIDCGGRYSMPSNHASNHFGLATFWFLSIQLMTGKKWYWLWLWAVIIAFAQVYVGKHYPFDITVGAILGMLIGFIVYKIFKRWSLQKFC